MVVLTPHGTPSHMLHAPSSPRIGMRISFCSALDANAMMKTLVMIAIHDTTFITPAQLPMSSAPMYRGRRTCHVEGGAG